MSKLKYPLFFLSSILLCHSKISAQNVDYIDINHPLKISGTLVTGAAFYGTTGIDRRYDPFIWTTSANLNLNLYGLNLPFSFIYSTQNSSIRQPFNRFGIAPYYKWVKAYLGYANMNFSPFTFGGNAVLGVGVELNPGKFRFAALYGRLRKSVANNFNSSFAIPVYRRTGFGMKVGYGDDNNFIDLIMFRSFDNPASIEVGDSLDINPQDNLVLGINGQLSLAKRIIVKVETATSAINRNIEAERTRLGAKKIYNKLGGLFKPTVTSEFYNAIQGSIIYQHEFFDFGLSYQRVDPGYETLSTYFFNNDREAITFNTGLRMLKNKLSVKAGVGQEKNNLAGGETTALKRIAGNAQINYAINEHLNLSIFYTNFSSTVEYLIDELQNELPDYLQVSETLGVNAMYSIRKGQKTHSILLNGNFQGQNIDVATENTNFNNTSLYNINSRYNLNFTPIKLRLNAGFNFNQSNLSAGNSKRYGVTVGMSKFVSGNKLQLTINAGGYNTFANDIKVNFTTNTRFTALYRMDKHHSLNTSMSLVSRQSFAANLNRDSFSEYRAQINYRYQF